MKTNVSASPSFRSDGGNPPDLALYNVTVPAGASLKVVPIGGSGQALGDVYSLPASSGPLKKLVGDLSAPARAAIEQAVGAVVCAFGGTVSYNTFGSSTGGAAPIDDGTVPLRVPAADHFENWTPAMGARVIGWAGR